VDLSKEIMDVFVGELLEKAGGGVDKDHLSDIAYEKK
jgi:hypothetical protein